MTTWKQEHSIYFGAGSTGRYLYDVSSKRLMLFIAIFSYVFLVFLKTYVSLPKMTSSFDKRAHDVKTPHRVVVTFRQGKESLRHKTVCTTRGSWIQTHNKKYHSRMVSQLDQHCHREVFILRLFQAHTLCPLFQNWRWKTEKKAENVRRILQNAFAVILSVHLNCWRCQWFCSINRSSVISSSKNNPKDKGNFSTQWTHIRGGKEFNSQDFPSFSVKFIWLFPVFTDLMQNM